MLRNISDYLSLTTLILITLYAIRTYLLMIIKRQDTDDNSLSRMELLRDYIYNEEE